MRIQHNITALNAHRNLTNNNSSVSKNLEKLSSGYRINRAGDDAAGLAISEKMRAQITGLEQAQKNAEDGVSLVQTAEGALTEVHSMLNRMVALATQSANGTYSQSNRAEMQKEIDALREEIDRISSTANFNGTKLFTKEADDAAAPADAVQVKAPTDASVTFTDGVNATSAATAAFDFTGVAFDKDGDVKVTVGGKDYTVAVTKDMTADKFATAFADAFNADKLTDADAGDFTAAAVGSAITLTSANQEAVKDTALADALKADIKIEGVAAEPAKQADAPAYAKDDVFSYDFSKAAQPNATETIEIAGQTYTFVANGATPQAGEIEIGADIAGTMNNIANVLNADANLKDKFTAAYDDATGALTLTAKADAATGDAAPTALTGTWAATANATLTPPAAKEDPGAEEDGEAVSIDLHVGESSADTNTIKVTIQAMSSTSLGIGEDAMNIKDAASAKAAIDLINNAIDSVSSIRSDLGALQNRLEHTINNLGVQTENITAAESRIRDVDMAKEMMAYTKNNILVQASQAMLAQANTVPQGVLQLLQ